MSCFFELSHDNKTQVVSAISGKIKRCKKFLNEVSNQLDNLDYIGKIILMCLTLEASGSLSESRMFRNKKNIVTKIGLESSLQN